MKAILTSFLALAATAAVAVAQVVFNVPAIPPKVSINTHFYDNARSGWQQGEKVLTAAKIQGGNFGVLARRTDINGEVDAQPLYVPNVSFSGVLHDVVYVVTMNNNVYALDAITGATLASANFGSPVPNANLVAGACNNNPTTGVGIQATPVIDPVAKTLYVMSFSMVSTQPTYFLHALDFVTLADKVSAVALSATQTLSDASTWTFDGTYEKNRAALLLANGKIYSAFAGYCDLRADITRGIMFAQDATTLAITNTTLNNSQNPDPLGNSYYLTTVWMSGAGPAIDASGNLYFSTGNSDSGASGGSTSYNQTLNLQESVIRMTPTFGLTDYYTADSLITWDQQDQDFSASGITVLPDLPGMFPHTAVTSSKAGTLYLLNRDNMGHWVNGGPNTNVLSTVNSGPCWCSPVYFVLADGTPRIAVSGGGILKTYTITSATFTADQVSQTFPGTGRDLSSFFATMSSDGTVAGSHIAWVLSNNAQVIELFAVDPTNGRTLYHNPNVGVWGNTHSNNNVPAVVANGHVYVASNGQFYILGLK